MNPKKYRKFIKNYKHNKRKRTVNDRKLTVLDKVYSIHDDEFDYIRRNRNLFSFLDFIIHYQRSKVNPKDVVLPEVINIPKVKQRRHLKDDYVVVTMPELVELPKLKQRRHLKDDRTIVIMPELDQPDIQQRKHIKSDDVQLPDVEVPDGDLKPIEHAEDIDLSMLDELQALLQKTSDIKIESIDEPDAKLEDYVDPDQLALYLNPDNYYEYKTTDGTKATFPWPLSKSEIDFATQNVVNNTGAVLNSANGNGYRKICRKLGEKPYDLALELFGDNLRDEVGQYLYQDDRSTPGSVIFNNAITATTRQLVNDEILQVVDKYHEIYGFNRQHPKR